MQSIQEQIEALTQELHPNVFNNPNVKQETWQNLMRQSFDCSIKLLAEYSGYTNDEDIKDYADCYRRLKLYQLLGEKAAKEYPVKWGNSNEDKFGTDFNGGLNGSVQGRIEIKHINPCVLGGVWFAREEDRLDALKICGIDIAFQERCAKYGLGGA